jgi:hypothetical protein
VNAGYNWGDSAVSSTAVGTGGTSLPVTIGLATFGTYNLDPNRNGFIGGGQAIRPMRHHLSHWRRR